MGIIQQGTCPKCGYRTEELYTGGGLGDCRPETARMVGHDDAGLSAALEKGARFQITRQLAICHRCRKLISAASVRYQRPGSEAYTIADVCPDCGGPLEWLSSEKKEVPCPVCGASVPLALLGRWD